MASTGPARFHLTGPAGMRRRVCGARDLAEAD